MFDFDLIQWLEQVWVATSGFFASILASVSNIGTVLWNIGLNVASIAEYLFKLVSGAPVPYLPELLASLLPLPNPAIINLIDIVFFGLTAFIPYIAMLDYVINLPALLLLLGVMALIETILMSAYVYLFIKRLIPFV